MEARSREVAGQSTPRMHAVDLALSRHRREPFRAPRTEHGEIVFASIDRSFTAHGGSLWFDVGCGTGEATRRLAARHPGAFVLGADKSAARLARGGAPVRGDNFMIVRADVVELLSRARAAGWRIDRALVLYPNPWPKPTQLRRRWHAHPSFLDLVEISHSIRARTNWEVYARELAHALRRVGRAVDLRAIAAPEGLTPFERKYAASGHTLWAVSSSRGPA